MTWCDWRSDGFDGCIVSVAAIFLLWLLLQVYDELGTTIPIIIPPLPTSLHSLGPQTDTDARSFFFPRRDALPTHQHLQLLANTSNGLVHRCIAHFTYSNAMLSFTGLGVSLCSCSISMVPARLSASLIQVGRCCTLQR